MSVFLNSNNDLRSGWRFVVYILIFALSLIATTLALSALIAFDPAVLGNEIALLGLNALILLFPAVLSLLFMVRFVDHVPAAVFGATLHDGWLRDTAKGLLLAGGMLVLFTLMGALIVNLRIEAAGFGVGTPLLIILVLSVAAANEELIFRGYPLQVLMLAIGPWPAMLVLSGLFGLLHHLNPNATWLGTINTFLAGVLLSLAYLRTRSLWFPYGIHVGWNVAIGPLSGYPVSGIDMRSFFHTELDGAAWITGDAYGPEGGALGTVVMVVAIVAVGFTKRLGVSPTLQSLLSEHSSKVCRTGTD